MRIMHFTRATLMIGQFLYPVIKEQKKRGHYVCVCGADDADAVEVRNAGIDVFTHHLKRGLNPFNIIREIFHIKKILIEQNIDVIVCHTPIGGGVGRLAARWAKIPHVIYFAHGLPCAPHQNPFLWFIWFSIEMFLAKFTDAILVMNAYDENLSKKYLMKNRGQIFNLPGMGVDLERFRGDYSNYDQMDVKNEFNIKNKKIVLCIAYLIPAKGVFILLEAASSICAQRDDVCVMLVGTGPSMGKLKNKIKNYNLENNFKLIGWRNDIPRLLNAADIFVLPTYYFEGLPVSILEAMACSKPVIASIHRGCQDVIEDKKTGFLVPAKQVLPIIDKIKVLLDDDKLRDKMGKAGRTRVENHYELNYCTILILDAIEKACQN